MKRLDAASDPGAMPPQARMDILDVLRGIAILGIFFINIGIMVEPPGAPGDAGSAAPHDAAMGGAIGLLVEGTQRGLLQMLFGAGMLLLTAKGARPDGPILVADAYFRRNLWLLGIGLAHVFVVGWAFDVVHVYAIAALFLFPFRLIRPASALALGLTFALLTLAGVIPGFGDLGGPGAGPGAAAGAGALARDRAVAMWLAAYQGFGLWVCVLESLGAMLIGVALFRWGITQGLRSRRFYLGMALAAYAVGFAVRLRADHGAGPGAPGGWDFDEVGRLAMTAGHVAAINLAWQSGAGRWLLRPFAAAGRIALSLYVLQSIAGLWVLASLPGGGPGREHPRATAAAVDVILLVAANLWIRRFRMGPVEWAWHRLIDLSRPDPGIPAEAGAISGHRPALADAAGA